MENGSAESHMKSFLQSKDYKGFLNAFNLYLCSGMKSENSTYFKSVALLCYLMEGNTLEFNKLIQTTKSDEMNNESIETVIKVADSIHRLDFESFKKILSTCPKALKHVIEKIMKNQQQLMESSLKHDAGESEAITKVSKDVIESMKDCIYVIKNFMGD